MFVMSGYEVSFYVVRAVIVYSGVILCCSCSL